MNKALHIPLEEFLRPFFGPGERICLRVFDDKKTGAFKGAKLETTLSGLPGLMDTLKKHNEQNRGIYFVVNFGGHEDAEISRVNAQFMECDELPLDEQMKQIEAFPLAPSLIVKTRKSLHTYWLIKDGDVAAFRRIQKRLVAQFHGDRSCVNESRVLRLPGFNHCKEEPVAVECIHFHPELRYTQAELEQYLPPIPEEPAAPAGPAAKGTRQGLSLVLRRCAFMQHCRDNAASLSEHDWYAMITNLAVFDGGDRAIYELSALYPGYKAAETQEKIQHFLQSGTKPIICRAIAEKLCLPEAGGRLLLLQGPGGLVLSDHDPRRAAGGAGPADGFRFDGGKYDDGAGVCQGDPIQCGSDYGPHLYRVRVAGTFFHESRSGQNADSVPEGAI